MAPYALQWEAIKFAKQKWFKLYDFLWVATPWDKKSSLLWVTEFKTRFTSDIREVSQSYIFINKKVKYLLISFFRKLKSILN
jgi:lipid II:glycine glycyltransferase (peptidoglycan interpeptide bridge formation enzyme)